MLNNADIIQLHEISELFNKLMEKIYLEYEEDRPEENDLTIAQTKCLFVVGSAETFKMSDIAARLNITLSGATNLVDKLVKMGLLVRKADETDRRIVLIALTSKGKNVVDRHMQARKKSFEIILNKLSAEKRKELIEAFSGIHKILAEAEKVL